MKFFFEKTKILQNGSICKISKCLFRTKPIQNYTDISNTVIGSKLGQRFFSKVVPTWDKKSFLAIYREKMIKSTFYRKLVDKKPFI